MRVFVTGATGFIGSIVVRELVGAGHHVTGLARSDEAAAALAEWGVEARRGDLADPAGLADAARAADGVIHTAFIHDFADYMGAVETDLRAVKALAGALEGSDKPLVIASGTLMVADASPATEQDGPASLDGPRAASEEVVRTAPGVRGVIVRLPPVVHARERQGLLTRIIPMAREKGVCAVVGEGTNRWPAVQRFDAARLFRLALEQARPGLRLHAVAEEGIPMRQIVEAMAEGLGLPVRTITPEEAPAYFEWFAGLVTRDNLTSSAFTRETTGWRPEQPGLLAGLRSGEYVA